MKTRSQKQYGPPDTKDNPHIADTGWLKSKFKVHVLLYVHLLSLTRSYRDQTFCNPCAPQRISYLPTCLRMGSSAVMMTLKLTWMPFIPAIYEVHPRLRNLQKSVPQRMMIPHVKNLSG